MKQLSELKGFEVKAIFDYRKENLENMAIILLSKNKITYYCFTEEVKLSKEVCLCQLNNRH